MLVKVYLVLKVIDKTINIIGINEELPTIILADSSSIAAQIDSYLKSELNLMGSWLDIRHVRTKVIQLPSPHLAIFYSSFVPKDFINDKDIKYIKEFSNMDVEIREEIQSSLRIPAY